MPEREWIDRDDELAHSGPHVTFEDGDRVVCLKCNAVAVDADKVDG